MEHLNEPVRRRAVPGAIVLSAFAACHYSITHNSPLMEIRPATGEGTFLLFDPTVVKFLVRRKLFENLASQWRKERNPLSSNAWDNLLSPAYYRITGMGPGVVPFILEELRRELKMGEPDDWFVALWAITGENPVLEESRGRLREMAKAWLQWGSQHGYIDGEELGTRLPELR